MKCSRCKEELDDWKTFTLSILPGKEYCYPCYEVMDKKWSDGEIEEEELENEMPAV